MMRRRIFATVLALGSLAATLAGGGASAAADPTPRGVHLSLGSDPGTSMNVVWHTAGTNDPGTVVQYGPTQALGASATGVSKPTPGLPPSRQSTLHEVALTRLAPASTTYYRVGDGTTWSPILAFRTPSSMTEQFSFAAFADHGRTSQSQATTAAVAQAAPDLAIIAGDVSYANSDLEEWDDWAEQVEPLAASIPLMAAPGNHDTDPGQTPTPMAFIERFAFPDEELFFSFDYGRVHFLMLHSTIGSSTTREYVARQFLFAEQDLLDAAARKEQGSLDFIIVVQHHPLYGNQQAGLSSQLQERNYNPPLIAWEERLFATHDVDVLIVGHNHHYERSFPMRLGQPTTTGTSTYVEPDGFIQVITGGGGAGLYDFKPESDFGAWSAVHHRRHHYVRFDVSAGLLRATTIATDGTGEILDEWTLRRS